MTATKPKDVIKTEPLKDVEKTAWYLDVSDRTVRNLVKRGKLGVIYVGKQLRFRESDIEAYLNSQFQPAEK